MKFEMKLRDYFERSPTQRIEKFRDETARLQRNRDLFIYIACKSLGPRRLHWYGDLLDISNKLSSDIHRK